MKNWNNFVEEGLQGVVNDYGEIRNTRKNSIVFPNGYVCSILEVPEGYSVAVCDWEGYFDWDIFDDAELDNHGGVGCETEKELCECLTFVEALPSIL